MCPEDRVKLMAELLGLRPASCGGGHQVRYENAREVDDVRQRKQSKHRNNHRCTSAERHKTSWEPPNGSRFKLRATRPPAQGGVWQARRGRWTHAAGPCAP